MNVFYKVEIDTVDSPSTPSSIFASVASAALLRVQIVSTIAS